MITDKLEKAPKSSKCAHGLVATLCEDCNLLVGPPSLRSALRFLDPSEGASKAVGESTQLKDDVKSDRVVALEDALAKKDLELAKKENKLQQLQIELDAVRQSSKEALTRLEALPHLVIWEVSWASNRAFVAAVSIEEAVGKVRHSHPEAEINGAKFSGMKVIF